MIGMSSSNFLFKTFLSTSNTTFELLLHFFYIGGNMLPASILSFVFSSKNELYMVWAGRRDPWWGWLRGWEHAIWLGCYYLFRKQRKCLLTQLQIAPLPSLASLTVRIFSWGTKLKRDWERSIQNAKKRNRNWYRSPRFLAVTLYPPEIIAVKKEVFSIKNSLTDKFSFNNFKFLSWAQETIP